LKGLGRLLGDCGARRCVVVNLDRHVARIERRAQLIEQLQASTELSP